MSVKDWVDIAQFTLNVVLAGFTVILYRQGQKDRRRVTEDREREQASPRYPSFDGKSQNQAQAADGASWQ
jgi:hypothetical protein